MSDTAKTRTLEDVSARCARLGLAPKETRMESLQLASEAGVDDSTFAQLANAARLSRGPRIVLPAHRYEGLSRGRGWARKGRGDAVEWGERTADGYRVGPGRWSVGATDGFRRKDATDWNVRHVTVGAQTWTIAE